MILGQVLLAFTDADGWSAGIGDPTMMGWITVAAYIGASVLAFRTARNETTQRRRFQERFWLLLAAMLLALGVNKQLDLQTWFTLAGKRIAQAQGWYEQRRIVQFVFIAGIVLAAALTFSLTWRWVAQNARDLWLPLLGFGLLACFVIVRAASFHHVDEFLHLRVVGVKMNWLLELGGISMIAAGAIGNSRRGLRLVHTPPASAKTG